MALTPTVQGRNAFAPGARAETFVPDQLIADARNLVTDNGTITGDDPLVRGTVMGQVTVGAAVSAAKAGGNTGTGTLTLDATTPVLAGHKEGVYSVRCTAAAANGGTFRVEDPEGYVLGDVAVGATFSDDLKFVIADGGVDFIVGDGFDITVAAGSGKWRECVAAAVDGSQHPAAILVDDADPSDGDVIGGLYLSGGFNEEKVTLGTGITLAVAKAALRPLGIILRNVVNADDPT